MTDDPLDVFAATAGQAERIIAGVRPDQLTLPTPCPPWDVRHIINHMVSGSLFFAGLIAGEPPLDRSGDFLGDDPPAAFRASAQRLSAAFAAPGMLSQTFDTPFLALSGAQVVLMRVSEIAVHTWDVASATGQLARMDPALAGPPTRFLLAIPDRLRGPDGPFDPVVPVGADADPVARLAAAAGRDPMRVREGGDFGGEGPSG